MPIQQATKAMKWILDTYTRINEINKHFRDSLVYKDAPALIESNLGKLKENLIHLRSLQPEVVISLYGKASPLLTSLARR